MLASDVATAYFNLIAADQLVDLQKRVVDLSKEDVKHAQDKLDSGLTSPEDLVIREELLDDQQSTLQDDFRMQSLALNQMAILLGKTTSEVADLPRTSWEQYDAPKDIAAGVPSELITRRPDVVAAEDRLSEAGLNVLVARKELLPDINLTGEFGFSSAARHNLFDWKSRVVQMGASATQGIFTGGQAMANLRIFKSQYNQHVITYRNTILQAFQDVDNALASLKTHQNSYEQEQSSLANYMQQLRIQENELSAGALAEADVVETRLAVAQSQEKLAQAKLAALTDTLSLYKSLGGGY